MTITIVAAGKLKERWLRDGVAEYAKRLSPFARLEFREVSEERMPDNPSTAERRQVLQREGERLLRQVPASARLTVLDVVGQAMTSEQLAMSLSRQLTAGQSRLAYLVGGAFGLSEEVRAAATLRLSLSPLTFTHQMARLLLVEQLYRAFKIMRGEPYHW